MQTAQQMLDLAIQQHRAGRLKEAEQLYRQVLTRQPNDADALHLLGVLAHQSGRNDIAVNLIRQAIAIRPNYPEACVNLGGALRALGRLDEAIAACQQAISLRPDYAEAFSNLGAALRETNRTDEAIAVFRQALALNPELPEAWSNLGSVLADTGDFDEAIAAYRQAIALNPRLAEPHFNLGNALKEKGFLTEAIAAHRQALALKPNYPQAWNNLGNALRDKGQLDEAVAAFRRGLAIQPDYIEVYNNLGNALRDMGELDEAIAAYRQAIARRPGGAEAYSNLLYTLHFHPAVDARTIANEHRDWNRRFAEPLRASFQPHTNDRAPDRRLRIGYVSPDFRDHVVGRNLLPLFRQHNRRNFEITCYSQSRRRDAMTRQFQENADCWRSIAAISDEQAAKQIRDDQIDILVDLTLHMAHNRLLVFAREPAPVQVSFAGYPGSTGLSAIDYRLSDPYLDPGEDDAGTRRRRDSQRHNKSLDSETTIRLADSFWCYDPLDCGDIPVSAIPARDTGIITFGCLNNFCKVNAHVIETWARTMQQVKNSRLLLMAKEGRHRKRTIDQLLASGIDPSRVEFIPQCARRAYLQLYHRIDIGLDTFPYNGHTTSLDSFWMGVPVITLVGSTPVARAGWCQLNNLGLTTLATQTPDDFVRVSVELSKDIPRLATLRSSLRQRMERSPLMDAPRFARNIEAAYRQMWQSWCECQMHV